jgi:hypothetical protein
MSLILFYHCNPCHAGFHNIFTNPLPSCSLSMHVPSTQMFGDKQAVAALASQSRIVHCNTWNRDCPKLEGIVNNNWPVLTVSKPSSHWQWPGDLQCYLILVFDHNIYSILTRVGNKTYPCLTSFLVLLDLEICPVEYLMHIFKFWCRPYITFVKYTGIHSSVKMHHSFSKFELSITLSIIYEWSIHWRTKSLFILASHWNVNPGNFCF